MSASTRNDQIGAIPAGPDNHSSIQDRSSGFRLVSGDAQTAAGCCDIVIGDEATPMTEDVWKKIIEELGKPKHEFVKTFDGQRFTKRIRNE